MNSEREEVYQNLLDAGCCCRKADNFMALKDAENTKAEVKFLEKRRREILDEMHRSREQLDCLDYLLYQYRR